MTLKERETLQRVAGILEGALAGCDSDKVQEVVLNAVEMLDAVLAEPTVKAADQSYWEQVHG